ncbi:glycosyltransferase [Streptomyces spinosisporus]|uniref:Glycosyltransferase family 28 n=1 Tax=Streptomyces spinosisporus TaxID=2927582 RepID=A0ABS9XKY2_9ACTN|nr:glycosyltransferase [Streptomyces spinosisporus]MCI3242724.1 glycosyltransferase family 28 [Streptomyces spinosisporus]
MTTLFVATTGGHLAQLVELADRLPVDGASVWVTHDNEQSRSLLAGRDVMYVPYMGPRSVSGVLRTLPRAVGLHAGRRITCACSTGSGLALAYLPYLAARGVRCHYIESVARVVGPSLTGRVLRRVPGVLTYTQYPQWSDGGWRYEGSVLDRYRAVPAAGGTGDPLRVVVTVGTATEYPFRRLFTRLWQLLAPGGPLERRTGRTVEVLWQTGGTPVAGLPLRATPFLPARELSSAVARADIVVSHAGAGSALAVLGAGRFPVLVPRTQRHKEAVDDHQAQLAEELVRRGLALRADADDLTVEQLLASAAKGVLRDDDAPAFALA